VGHIPKLCCLANQFPVAEKLKHEGRQELSAMEKAEEFEDADGNVYDKKTYEDLKRQGLL
jgi:splicing factor 3A subunit 3